MALGDLTVNLVANDAGLEDALDEVATASRKVSQSLEKLDDTLNELPDSMGGAAASANQAGEKIQDFGQDSTVANTRVEGLSDGAQQLAASLTTANTSLSKGSKESKNLAASMQAAQGAVDELGQESAMTAVQTGLLAQINNKLSNSSVKAAASTRAAASGIDEMGDEATEATGQLLSASSAADLLSLKSSALSVNFGAFTIALRNLTTQVPLLVASLGNLGAAFTGLATAVGGVGIGGLAASLGGMLAKAKENGANLNDMESVMQSLSSTSQELQERLIQAFMPLVEMEGAISTFEGLLDGIVKSVNSFSQAVATTFTIQTEDDDLQNLGTTISQIAGSFNKHIDSITAAIGDVVLLLGDDLASMTETVLSELPSFFRNVAAATEDVINIVDRAVGGFGRFVSQATELGRQIGAGLAPVMNVFFSVIADVIAGLHELDGQTIATAAKVGVLLLAINRLAGIMGTLAQPIAGAVGHMMRLAATNGPLQALKATLVEGGRAASKFSGGIRAMSTAFQQILPPVGQSTSLVGFLSSKLSILSIQSLSASGALSTLSGSASSTSDVFSTLNGAFRRVGSVAVNIARRFGLISSAMGAVRTATAPLASAMTAVFGKAHVAISSLRSSMLATSSASELLGNALKSFFVPLDKAGGAVLSASSSLKTSLITALQQVVGAAIGAGSAMRTFGATTRAALTGIGAESVINSLVSDLAGTTHTLSGGSLISLPTGQIISTDASGVRKLVMQKYIAPMKASLVAGKESITSSITGTGIFESLTAGFGRVKSAAASAKASMVVFGQTTRAALTGIGAESVVSSLVSNLSKTHTLDGGSLISLPSGQIVSADASGVRKALSLTYLKPFKNFVNNKLAAVTSRGRAVVNKFGDLAGGLDKGFGNTLSRIANGPLRAMQGGLGKLTKLADRDTDFGFLDLASNINSVGAKAVGAIPGVTALQGALSRLKNASFTGVLNKGFEKLTTSIIGVIPFTGALNSAFMKLTQGMLASGGAVANLGNALRTVRRAIVGNIGLTKAIAVVTQLYSSNLNTLIAKLLAGGRVSRFFGTALQLTKAAILGNITATAALSGILSTLTGASSAASASTLAFSAAESVALVATQLLSGGISILTAALSTLASVLAVATGGLILAVGVIGTAAAALGVLGKSGSDAESLIGNLTNTLKSIGNAVMPAVVGSANVMMDIFNSILTPVKALISGFKQVGVALGLISEDAGEGGIVPMPNAGSKALQKVLNDVGKLARLFGSFLTSKIETATSVITSLIGENEGKINNIKSTVVELASTWGELVDPVTSFAKQITSTAVPVIENLIGTVVGLGQKVVGIFTGGAGIGAFLDMITRIQDAIMSGVGPTLDFLSVLFTGIAKSVDAVTAIVDGALNMIIGLFGFVVEAIGGVVGALTGTEDKGGSLMSTLASGVEFLMSGFNSLIGGLTTIMNFFIQLYNVVAPILGFMFKVFMNIAGIVGGILIDGLIGLASVARSVAIMISNAFMDNFGFIIDGMMDVIDFIDAGIQSIIDGFLSIPEAVAGFWNDTIGGMTIEIGGEKLMDVPTIDAGGMGSGGGGSGDSESGGIGGLPKKPSIDGSNLNAEDITSGAGTAANVGQRAKGAVMGGMGSSGNVTVDEGDTRNIFNQTISADPEDEVQMGRIAKDAMAEANSFKRRQQGSQ